MKYLPRILTILFVVYLCSALRIPNSTGQFELKTFGQLPVLQGGRVKPFDTVARTVLLSIAGKQIAKSSDGTRKTPVAWAVDLMFGNGSAETDLVFEIDDPDVLGLLGIKQGDTRLYSYATLAPHLEEIDRQGRQSVRIAEDKRTRFQKAVLTLREKIFYFERLRASFRLAESGKQADAIKEIGTNSQNSDLMQRVQTIMQLQDFFPIAASLGTDENDSDWIGVGEALSANLRGAPISPSMTAYFTMADAYSTGNSGLFNSTVMGYFDTLQSSKPRAVRRSQSEALFNHFEPFYQSMVLYIPVLLLAFAFWLTQRPVFNDAAFNLLILAFIVHSLGLGSRMILQGRPPVTNLYSSAVFVGWGAVVLGIILERMYRNGVGNVVSAVIGFSTLIIAHHLSLQGDTMEMMRAVLDSNFWLTTHVVAITIGYSSTFLSGFIAIVYLFRRAFDRSFDAKTAVQLGKMVYGIICFSTVFSFVGTVLGGIWADQSWGRFWGWDPKENGALLVVLWNILILHARPSVDARTTMMLTVFGNVITVLSWFGVNMLGVGLHSYGFMDKALTWMVIFIVVQCVIIMTGYLPSRAEHSQRPYSAD